MTFHVPEKYRITRAVCAVRRLAWERATDERYGCNGNFILPPRQGNRELWCIVSDGEGWEHVSVHARSPKGPAIPNWEEMCYVKGLFWEPEDVVMQLHPRESQYCNNHPHVLHLWRPNDGTAIPEPPSILVGLVTGSAA